MKGKWAVSELVMANIKNISDRHCRIGKVTFKQKEIYQ